MAGRSGEPIRTSWREAARCLTRRDVVAGLLGALVFLSTVGTLVVTRPDRYEAQVVLPVRPPAGLPAQAVEPLLDAELQALQTPALLSAAVERLGREQRAELMAEVGPPARSGRAKTAAPAAEQALAPYAAALSIGSDGAGSLRLRFAHHAAALPQAALLALLAGAAEERPLLAAALAERGGPARVVAAATVRRVEPWRPLVWLALPAALLAAAAVSLGSARWRRAFVSADEVEALLQVPVLATPRLDRARLRRAGLPLPRPDAAGTRG